MTITKLLIYLLLLLIGLYIGFSRIHPAEAQLHINLELLDSLKVKEHTYTTALVSAYNALEVQTDSTPTIMASGKTVYVGAIANNCLPFNTKVLILEEVYTVEDRMNRRYDCNHYDIYLESYEEAIKWGVKKLEIEILDENKNR